MDVPKIQPAKFLVHTPSQCFADVSPPQLTCKRGHWARRGYVIKTVLEPCSTGQTLDDPIGRYNVAPTTKVQVLHTEGEGIRLDTVPWGWAPFWAKGPGKRPPPINARIETVATSKFFKGVWPNGRALVFADGWYEWLKDEADPKKKQPYFIRLKSQRPMFFGALAEVHPGLEPGANDGFVIITAASDTGMVDIHDRRPLVLTPELAREWIEPDRSPERAEEIAREHCQPTEDFDWYPVSTAVGNVRNHDQELTLPVG